MRLKRKDGGEVPKGDIEIIDLYFFGNRPQNLQAGQIVEVSLPYELKVPKGERLRIIGAGLRLTNNKGVQYIEVMESTALIRSGEYDTIRFAIRCGRAPGAGLALKNGDLVAHLVSDINATMPVNKAGRPAKAA